VDTDEAMTAIGRVDMESTMSADATTVVTMTITTAVDLAVGAPSD
jgi:hypothetical protein